MLSIGELFEDKSGDDSLLSRGLADYEYVRAHRFMIPWEEVMSVDPWLKKPEQVKVHPKSGMQKREQINSFMLSFEEGYVKRLKTGFRLVLGMLGEMAGDEDDDYATEEDHF